jgi:hypothetical protein
MRRVALIAPLLLVACGSRTALLVDDEAAEDAHASDAGRDAARPRDGGADAHDARPPPQPCTKDSDCNDGIACTRDVCELPARTCDHLPDDTQCPLSYGCDPALGCQARALASTADQLYEVKLPSGALRPIGATSPPLDDIALAPDRTVYAVTSSGFFRVDSSTAAMTLLGPQADKLNALDVSPEGTLYGAGNVTLSTIDTATGATTPIANFPPGLSSSGDLAFYEGRLLATARGAFTGDALLEFDRKTGGVTMLGNTGFACIYGLAAFGPTLYGLTCEGNVLTIDVATARASLVTKTNVRFFGATAR